MTDDPRASLQDALAGAYTVEQEIGRGGMGVVYRAHDNHHDRTVAIKVLREEIASSVGAARFNQEIRIEARLQHPNIVPVHEWAERGGLLFCVMPLIAGESLRSRLQREGQLPIPDALRIAREIASALAYAHEQGIVHRDVKPENVLLSSGHAMLTDFGVARVVGDANTVRLTASGLAVGTVSYMSPEQAAGDARVDARSDIYALGCVLYEMLAGDPPFGSSTPRVVLARHMRDRPPPIEGVRPSVPPQIAAALARALEKVPADRFPTAAAFADALEMPGTPGSSTPAQGRNGIPGSRARAWRLGTAVAAVLAVAGAAWLWSRTRTPLDDRRVLVFPLQSASDVREGGGAGWDVAIAISASLEHAEPLRVMDGYSYLDADMRRDMRLLTAAEARRLSRERGARYYVDGAITRRGDSVDVVLRLHDARGDSLVGQESATGGVPTPPPTLGLRAVARLLPRLLDPTRRIDVTHLAERKQGAVALWIQGEREYRLSRFGSALDFLRRAVREDSALAIAAVRGAQAASWESRMEEAEAFARAAVDRRQYLPPRYATFAVGLQHYLHGNADSARTVLEGLLKTNADDAESAMALAEVYQHLLGGPSSPPDSAAERWLNEAMRRDSAFTPPLFHLAQVVLRRGDVDRADALIATLRRRGAEPSLVAPLQLISTCVRGGDADWERTANVDGERVLAAARELLAHLAQPQCAERALMALLKAPGTSPGVRWSALLHLNGLLVASRRDVELRALLDSTVAAGTSQARSLYIIDAVAGADRSLMGPKADESAAFAQKAYGESYERASPQTRWVLGLWHGLQGDTARLARMTVVSDSVAGAGGRRERLFAQAMHANLALARGDTTAAIEVLRRIRPSARRDSLTYELFEPLAVERSRLALLFLARGAYEDALREASMLEHPEPAIYLPFLPLSLDIRARAAEALDRTALASQFRTRLRGIEALHARRP